MAWPVISVIGVACGSSSSNSTAPPAGPPAGPPGGADSGEASSDAGAYTGACTPVVTGPITGPGLQATETAVDLQAAGYVEGEYFFECNATAYNYVGTPGNDGKWSVKTTTTAAYKTRLLVRRPSDPSAFNGTVVVEWLNVSGGTDADPDFSLAHVELLRAGFAWVGVSAQAVGVQGGGFALTQGAAPLATFNPQRYGSLHHPGDSYAYDIYTQAVLALRHPSATANPLGSLTPARFIATGESQSAGYMLTYANAIQPVTHAFDGIFIHSRSATGSPLTASTSGGLGSLLAASGPTAVHIRSDLTIPVFQFETETDVLGIGGLSGFATVRQPDTDRLRSWEVAGTSHADLYLLTWEAGDAVGQGLDAGADASGTSLATALGCSSINDGPQHWVEDAAYDAMQAWLKDGTPPPSSPLLTMVDGGGALAKDALGNTLGGIRTAAVDAPIAVLSGESPTPSLICGIFGETTPFSAAQLLSLYPTHDDYVTKVTMATTSAQQKGFVVAGDVPLIEQEAQAADIPPSEASSGEAGPSSDAHPSSD